MIKCLMGVSDLGVLLMEGDKVVWKYLTPGERVYGLDYDPYSKNILFGSRHFVTEIDFHGKILRKHKVDEENIHSCFYTNNYKNIMVTRTESDAILEMDRYSGKTVWEWKATDHWEKPERKDRVSRDWVHLNYANRFGKNVWISLYRHPLFPDESRGGIVLRVDYPSGRISVTVDHLCKPHFAIPTRWGFVVADTGNNKVKAYTWTGGLFWEYEPENVDLPKVFEKSERPKIKYGKGAHYLELVDNNLFVVLPNHRCARLINGKKKILKEWKVPEKYWKGYKAGKGPRLYQAKLVNVDTKLFS